MEKVRVCDQKLADSYSIRDKDFKFELESLDALSFELESLVTEILAAKGIAPPN